MTSKSPVTGLQVGQHPSHNISYTTQVIMSEQFTFKNRIFDKETITKRLYGNIQKDETTDCWVWLGSKNQKGYGRLHLRENGKRIQLATHRLSYTLEYGTDPNELLVCHHCDNPSCINPEHLFLGTIKDNNNDAFKKKRNQVIGLKNRVLTEEQVREIKKELQKNNNASLSKIGSWYDVSPACIHSIKHGKSWAHVSIEA